MDKVIFSAGGGETSSGGGGVINLLLSPLKTPLLLAFGVVVVLVFLSVVAFVFFIMEDAPADVAPILPTLPLYQWYLIAGFGLSAMILVFAVFIALLSKTKKRTKRGR